jgi:hypothetical protein
VTDTVSNLMEASLLGVFNERDAQRRARAIETAYAPDVRWTEDEGICVGREALEAKVRELQSHMDGIVLAKASPVYQTRGFGYLAWRLGPKTATPWRPDSTPPSCATTSSPSSIQSSLGAFLDCLRALHEAAVYIERQT